MDVFEAIKGRRSIRKFKQGKVSRDLIEKILDAARWAPSGGNIQPWKFIVVDDEKVLERIKSVSPGLFGDPPALIVICSEKERAFKVGGKLARDYLTIADCSMAAQNMCLAAYALGLGSCIVKSFSSIGIKEILEIPEGIEPELIVTIGWPDITPSPPPRKSIEEITYLNKYGVTWSEK